MGVLTALKYFPIRSATNVAFLVVWVAEFGNEFPFRPETEGSSAALHLQRQPPTSVRERMIGERDINVESAQTARPVSI
jgi:hypothetical protein